MEAYPDCARKFSYLVLKPSPIIPMMDTSVPIILNHLPIYVLNTLQYIRF